MTNPNRAELSAVSKSTRRGRHRGPIQLSAVALVIVFATYCVHWVTMHGAFLFDPALQNDDARTALFPFHRYGMNPWLVHDPIAREMMAYVTPGLWLLYRCLVPLTSLYVASKCVQGLALAVLIAAGYVMARSRRTGLAAGLLLIFLMLSDSYAVGRIAGGHARAFAFPCFALWVAGILAKNRRARVAAPLIGSLFYPAVMLMILAAEAFYALRHFWRVRASLIARRIRRTALLATACAVLALPSVIGGDPARGPIHTLAQAQKDPAFFSSGRLSVLPLGSPSSELISAFTARFAASGQRLFGGKWAPSATSSVVITLVVLCIIVWFRWRDWTSLSEGVGAFLLGSVALYFAARVFAFRLYSTERYYAYCMRMASCLLLVAVASRLMLRYRSIRAGSRNMFAVAIMLTQWIFLGDGIIRNNGMTLDSHWDADLYGFIRTLPLNVRFACHPMDGDGIPYYAARATNGTFETLQPWFVDSWRRQKAREYATLDALYSTRLEDLVTYGHAYAVTHLLLNSERYDGEYKLHTASFEPFSSYLNHIVGQPDRSRPALAQVPASAVIFDRSPWRIVDLERLERSLSAARSQLK